MRKRRLEPSDDALEGAQRRRARGGRSGCGRVMWKRARPACSRGEDVALRLGRGSRHGRLDVDPVALGERVRHLVVVRGARRSPRRDRPLGDRELRIGDHELGIDLELRAQPGAVLAHSRKRVRRVERRSSAPISIGGIGSVHFGQANFSLEKVMRLTAPAVRTARRGVAVDDRHRHQPVSEGDRGSSIESTRRACAGPPSSRGGRRRRRCRA